MPVYKDTNSNTWYFSVRYKDVYGNSKRKLKRGFNKQKDAKLAEAAFLNEVVNGYSPSHTYEHVFYHYLEHSDLRPKTKRRRENEYKRHVQERFGHIKMNEIKQQQCQEFRTYLINTFDSPNSARTVWSGFISIINYAKKYFGLMNDPTVSIKPIQRIKPKPKYILREEFDEKVELFNDIDYRDASKLMYYTGLRVGECFALTWNDIDIDKCELEVNKTLDFTTRTTLPRAKNEASEDVVVYPQFIQKMLTTRYEEEKKKWPYFKDDYYVFGGMVPKHYSHYHKRFKEIFGLSIHALRHSYASYLANNGVDIFDLQQLMRHARISETMDTYSHHYTNKKHAAISVFDK